MDGENTSLVVEEESKSINNSKDAAVNKGQVEEKVDAIEGEVNGSQATEGLGELVQPSQTTENSAKPVQPTEKENDEHIKSENKEMMVPPENDTEQNLNESAIDETLESIEDAVEINKIDGVIGKDDGPLEPVPIEELDAGSTPPPQIESNDITEEEEGKEDPKVKDKGNPDEERKEDFKVNDEENPDDAIALEQEDEMLVESLLDETESIEEHSLYDREQLLQQYKEALEERTRIQTLNQQYQHKLAEYFKKKKTDDRGQEIEKNVTDQEQRYLKYISNLEELQAAEAQQASSIEIQLEELKSRCQEKQEKVEETSDALMNFKYEIAKTAINSRSGKPLTSKDVEQYQALEAKKELEVIAVRLEYIKLKNRLKKREIQLKAKEELAEGLHLIDFEQLKIENQTYNEKIEERNEELLKLRKKITTTVQVLTHLKEKLQFVQGENGEQRAKLRDIEATVAQRRDILTRMKQVRDGLRIDNTKLKHKSGLLGNKPLLRDFEVRKDEGEELKQRIQFLKEEHIELSMALNSIKKKIEKSRPVNS
ncbi:coiled-coil domain-containing protein 96-like [Hydractinia symbiolongicarpus]|uniref:coiled-coil domain-containing protein 96-like n=1 Tax=Hydractinia symbiolongicarpus TaxID=13093 RepID=UPI00254E13A3|nr:coiled-coil domain-containing protein 96-like [Hydractinia symbiolongicarpus]